MKKTGNSRAEECPDSDALVSKMCAQPEWAGVPRKRRARLLRILYSDVQRDGKLAGCCEQ